MISRPIRKYNKNPSRRKQATGPGSANELTRRTPIGVTLGASTTAFATATFDQPIVVSGIPALTSATTPSITCTAFQVLTPTTCKITMSAAPGANVVWPFEDPAVRNSAGGFVPPGTISF